MPQQVLSKYWGYSDFRPLQLEIIQSVLEGHDTLGLLPTGGGKSITFQVPAMMLDGITIVVTPLISLMKDQVDNLLSRGIRAYCLHSGLSRAETRLTLDRCRLGKTRLLYVSPERLQSESFMLEARQWSIAMIVVDEAHCISQWGYDFRPSYLKINNLRELAPEAPVLALTASATPEVADDIMLRLGFRPGCRKFAKSFSRDNLSYVVRYDDFKERTLLRVLHATAGSAIVYVRSRRRTRELAELLEKEGISASHYHAGLDPLDKAERQTLWKDGAVRVMVATNAFGMGIDKPDVRVVIHFDLPSSLEEYYQEAGRAGRDGKSAYAVVIAAKSDKGLLSRRLADAFPPKDYIAHVYEMACNFLEIAVGSGYDSLHEFDFNLFCQRFKLQPAMAYSALKLLTQAQYVEYVDEVQSRSRAMIIAPKSELYSLCLSPQTDHVFSELQREYTGLFSDYTHIEEAVIARRADVSEQQVYDSLLELSRMKVISYVPKKRTPYLYVATSREEPRHILIPRSVYEERKSRMQARIDSMKRFVFDSTQCRAVTLLQYFGETGRSDCGYCDVCRARNAAAPSISDINATLRYLASHPGGCDINTAIASIRAPRTAVVECIRSMAESKKIVMNGNKIALGEDDA